MQIDMSTLEGRRQWVFQNWSYWAGYAYEQYKLHGRGALIYRANFDQTEYALSVEDFPELNQMIKEYNPESQIVVMFLAKTLPRAHGTYQVNDMTPPQAYQKMLEERKQSKQRFS
jgi:hypothetical protein